MNENELMLSFNGNDEAQSQLLSGMINKGFRIKSLREQKKSIEQILLEMNASSNPEQIS